MFDMLKGIILGGSRWALTVSLTHSVSSWVPGHSSLGQLLLSGNQSRNTMQGTVTTLHSLHSVMSTVIGMDTEFSGIGLRVIGNC